MTGVQTCALPIYRSYKNTSNKYGYGSAIWAGLLSTVTVSSEAEFTDNVAEDKNNTEIYVSGDAVVTVNGSDNEA